MSHIFDSLTQNLGEGCNIFPLNFEAAWSSIVSDSRLVFTQTQTSNQSLAYYHSLR